MNGKSDTLDAENAARSVLAGFATAVPKTADGEVEMIRQLKIAHDSAVPERSAAMALTTTEDALRSLARRRQHLDAEAKELSGMIEKLITHIAPQLLEQFGIGVDSAAEILTVTGDNPERIRSERGRPLIPETDLAGLACLQFCRGRMSKIGAKRGKRIRRSIGVRPHV